MLSLFSSHSRNKKHLCSCSGWNFFKYFPGFSLVRLSHNVYFDHPRTWKSLFPFQIFEYPLFIFCFVCLHFLPESADQLLCNISFPGPSVPPVLVFFILPSDVRAVSHSLTDSCASSKFFIYGEIVFNDTVIIVAFII